ncbi:uncharacterized protein TRUGW13939_01185 [Talaromyces rugulosus]|uniref:Zn(2)-C6 fungal-type domain-containing protein n=1 Tax=Talaromyces rugulosus TaxID=121627 RepID=A0A7H8QK86_TALRU|nr:uncharacterized protein TRUGW13939_01185 [Talaromyces rugulosus]QKX54102.1 hypothetical protein TRUGW13939_01185 [Talaromyces rugulosus]
MVGGRRVRSSASERACLQCKKRKTRCVSNSNTDAICSYCAKMSKACVFETPPTRTPLTRRNLDAAEARCKELELRLRQLQAAPKTKSSTSSGQKRDAAVAFREEDSSVISSHSASAVRKHVESPAELGFEWQEVSSLGNNQSPFEEKKIQDGMVSLAASGYSGSTSGSTLLQSLLPGYERKQPVDAAERRRPVSHRSSAILALPFGERLATSLVQTHLIDAYFVAYHPSYPIVHERTFRDQCERKSQIPSQSSWHVVYYMVLAIGEWVSGCCTSDDHSIYYELAHARIGTEILQSGNMVIFQALQLLGNYLQKRDRPNTGYNYLGIAYRVALGLGLHREIGGMRDIHPFALQRRRLLFWTLYCFDSGFSITTGRPIMVADSFIDVHKPKNIDDSLLDISLSTEAEYPTVYSAIISQARLAVIANKIHTTFLATHPCADVNHSLAVMEQNLQNWHSALPGFFMQSDVPTWFIGPRQIIFWKEANLRILLLLACQRQQSEEHDKAAIGAKYETVAARTTTDIADFCHAHADLIHIGLSWYAVYFTLQACLAVGVNRLRMSPRRNNQQQVMHEDQDPVWERPFSSALQCLEKLGRFYNPATRSLRIIERLRSKIRSSASVSSASNSNLLAPENALCNGIVDESISEHTGAPATDQFDTDEPPSELMQGRSPHLTSDFNTEQWVSTVDPSLHMFLDDLDSIGNLFEGIQGFPNTMEADDFSYGVNTTRMTFS